MASHCASPASWSDASLWLTVARLAAKDASIDDRGHRARLSEPSLLPRRAPVRATRASFRVRRASFTLSRAMASHCASPASWSDASLWLTVARLAAKDASIDDRGHRARLSEPSLLPRRAPVRATRASFSIGGASLERTGGLHRG